MKLLKRVSMLAFGALALVAIAGPSGANGKNRPLIVRAWLTGYEEAPLTLSSPGRGFFRAIVDEDEGTIQYWLTYSDVPITQSHLHLGTHHQAGGITVFLCTNLGNPPAGQTVQACPGPTSGQITGTITSENVIPPGAAPSQGLKAGDFAALVDAIRNDAVYVNIHTVVFAAGEIRGQLQ
jgi:CHRD domain